MQLRAPRRLQTGRPGLVVLGLLAVCALPGGICASCSGEPADQAVSPLDADEPDGREPAERTDADRSEQRELTDEPVASHDAGTATVPAELKDLLARFDSAISALYAEPLAAGDDRHPLTAAWLRVVLGGSELDREVRGRILASGTDDRIHIVADADGVSFHNRALEVTEEADGSVVWTNCGYAPGIGVDMDSGEVVDDQRTHTIGRGRAVIGVEGTLLISELWDDESRLLEPGETDPCRNLVQRDKATDGDTP